MLPPFIIEQIRRREEEERRRRTETVKELHLPEGPGMPDRAPAEKPARRGDRGVVIIDLGG